MTTAEPAVTADLAAETETGAGPSQATGLPTALGVVGLVTLAVVSASAVLGPVSAPEFFITYALLQAAVFLGLVYLADLYEREPLGAVGIMVFWGATVACLLALPGNEFVRGLLSERVRTVFGAAIAAPVVEEAAKGCVLLFAFWLSHVAAGRFGTRPFEGVSGGLVYGAAVGMGFAFTEDVFFFFGEASVGGVSQGYEVFQSRVDLFGLNMLGHSTFTGLFGAGLGLATVLAGRGWRLLAAGAGFAAGVVAHALHNGMVSIVLTARFGLDVAAAWLSNDSLPPDSLRDVDSTSLRDVESTAEFASTVSDALDYLIVVGLFFAVSEWLRRQQRVIASGLADEDPDVAAPDQVHLAIHYWERLRCYAGLLVRRQVDQWRLARVVHTELVSLAFLKHRARQGRAPGEAVERQRLLVAWAEKSRRAEADRPDRGSAELLALSDEALRSSRYDLAQALLTVRAELVVPDDLARGEMAVVAGRQLAESIFRYQEALGEYDKALACFDRVLARDPESASAHMQRAGALFRRGEAQAELGRRTEAIESYAEGAEAADAAIAIQPGLAAAHRSRAASLMRLGEAHNHFARWPEAAAACAEATAAGRAALALTPDDAQAHNIVGLAHLNLGEAQAGAAGVPVEAGASFEQAEAACAEAVRLAPDFAYAHLNAGRARSRRGDLAAAAPAAPGDAEGCYERALRAFDDALEAAPGYSKALAARASTRARQATLAAAGGRHEESSEGLRRALADCGEALRLTPDYLQAHASQAEVLLAACDLELRRDRSGPAAEHAAAAVGKCDEAISSAPDDAALHVLRARALLTRARAATAGGRWDEAGEARHHAREEAGRALDLAPARDDARRAWEEASAGG